MGSIDAYFGLFKSTPFASTVKHHSHVSAAHQLIQLFVDEMLPALDRAHPGLPVIIGDALAVLFGIQLDVCC
jgi:hypothetical protein